jgi:hypothetical protein
MPDQRTSNRKVFEEPFLKKLSPRPGRCYQIKEPKPDLLFRTLHHDQTGPSLVISRTPIDNYTKARNDAHRVIWLSGLPGEDQVKGDDLGRLVRIIKTHLDMVDGGGGIYLEGLEYLTLRNSFTMMIEFLRWIKERIISSDMFLVVSLYPETFEDVQLDQLNELFDDVLL